MQHFNLTLNIHRKNGQDSGEAKNLINYAPLSRTFYLSKKIDRLAKSNIGRRSNQKTASFPFPFLFLKVDSERL